MLDVSEIHLLSVCNAFLEIKVFEWNQIEPRFSYSATCFQDTHCMCSAPSCPYSLPWSLSAVNPISAQTVLSIRTHIFDLHTFLDCVARLLVSVGGFPSCYCNRDSNDFPMQFAVKFVTSPKSIIALEGLNVLGFSYLFFFFFLKEVSKIILIAF